MSPLKKKVLEIISGTNFEEEIEALVSENPRAVRHLLGLTYRNDPMVSQRAARGMAIAGRHHKKLVQETVRQLVWAMNDESGTNALSAPAVLIEIARERSELLLPMVPDLLRLCSADEGLRDGLSATLKIIAEQQPGKVSSEIEQHLAHPQRAVKQENERLRRYKRQRALLLSADEGNHDD